MGVGCCRIIPQTAAEYLFFLVFFFKNSSYSSRMLQTSSWPLPQPNSPSRPGTDWVRVCNCPALPSRRPQSQWVHTASVHLLLHLYFPQRFQASRFLLVLFKPCLVGREPLTWVSPKNPVAELAGAGLGAAAALVPELVPGTLSSQSNLLTI